MDGFAQNSRWRIRIGGCLIALLVPVMLLMVTLKACQWADAHPSDAHMEREFHERRQAFDTLLQMVRQERRITRIANDFIWIDGIQHVPQNQIDSYVSPGRLAKYRDLFRVLNLESGITRHSDQAVSFLRSSSGSIMSGSSKEYLWSPKYDGSTLAASDPRTLEETCSGNDCSSIRKIASDWYITLDRD